jgi:hypothetical protein|nr:MAG TPA: Multiple organellar RNA editing factor [Caudoviricetes sp.]
MLEKVGGTSENGAAPELDEKLLEKISYIPKVVSIEVCRYSKRTAQEFIDYINNQLVPDCKIFVTIFIGDEKYKFLDSETKRVLNELYVAWKIYESLEKEKISEDKRDTLYKLLESLKGSSEDGSGSSLLNDNRYGRIYRF